jgi:hypothetical protein
MAWVFVPHRRAVVAFGGHDAYQQYADLFSLAEAQMAPAVVTAGGPDQGISTASSSSSSNREASWQWSLLKLADSSHKALAAGLDQPVARDSIQAVAKLMPRYAWGSQVLSSSAEPLDLTVPPVTSAALAANVLNPTLGTFGRGAAFSMGSSSASSVTSIASTQSAAPSDIHVVRMSHDDVNTGIVGSLCPRLAVLPNLDDPEVWPPLVLMSGLCRDSFVDRHTAARSDAATGWVNRLVLLDLNRMCVSRVPVDGSPPPSLVNFSLTAIPSVRAFQPQPQNSTRLVGGILLLGGHGHAMAGPGIPLHAFWLHAVPTEPVASRAKTMAPASLVSIESQSHKQRMLGVANAMLASVAANIRDATVAQVAATTPAAIFSPALTSLVAPIDTTRPMMPKSIATSTTGPMSRSSLDLTAVTTPALSLFQVLQPLPPRPTSRGGAERRV